MAPLPYTTLYAILRTYKDCSIDFIAEQMQTSRQRIMELLKPLEEKGAVQREGRKVRLSEQAKEEDFDL